MLFRHQSKDFYTAGFDALLKRWDKCISVGGGYVEKLMGFFLSRFEYHKFYVLYPFVTYLLTLPRSSATEYHWKCLYLQQLQNFERPLKSYGYS
jgi:hypothetical protein